MSERRVAEPIRLTYDDLCALPEDGRRYEILRGDLFMSPSPSTWHQRIAFNLAVLLRVHVARGALGEVFIAPLDVLLDEHNIVEPDIIYVSAARRDIVRPANIQGAPDLLVEVLSESTADRDRRDKRNLYARCGVDHYWIVDPAERLFTELQRVETAYAVVGEHRGAAEFSPRLFPDLVLPLREVWV